MNQIKDYIEKKFDSKMLVFGGPGTGKTYSVIERVKHLIEREDLSIYSNILILSFTRAAVQELQKRFSEIDGLKSLRMNICTFDEFAARINKSLNPTGRNIYGSYEQNIHTAIKNLHIVNHNDNLEVMIQETPLGGVKHLLIDEIQDLNKIRAKLVSIILELFDNLKEDYGFTLLGDLNQEIFSYSQNEETTSNTFNRSRKFISWIYSNYEEVETFTLPLDVDTNYRFRDLNSSIKDTILGLSDILDKADTFEINSLMNSVNGLSAMRSISTLESTKDLFSFVNSIKELNNEFKNKKTVALLFRSNKSAFFFSLVLFMLNVPHRILLENLDKIFPPWIAYFIHKNIETDPNGDFIYKFGDFLDLWNEESSNDFANRFQLDVKSAWQILSLLLYNEDEREIIELKRIYQIFSKRVNEAILHDSGLINAEIIVSTIHKSKGREYDYVFLFTTGFAELGRTRKKILEEIRVRYVGITRCKYGFNLFDYGYEYYYKNKRQKRRRFNPKNYISGVYRQESPLWWVYKDNILDEFSFIGRDLRVSFQKQDYIWKNLTIGEPVILSLKYQEDVANVIGKIIHDDTEIGQIKKEDAQKIVAITLKRRQNRGRRSSYHQRIIYPSQFHKEYIGLRIIAITSEMAPSYSEEELSDRISQQYLNLKFWLGFRVAGPIYPKN